MGKMSTCVCVLECTNILCELDKGEFLCLWFWTYQYSTEVRCINTNSMLLTENNGVCVICSTKRDYSKKSAI